MDSIVIVEDCVATQMLRQAGVWLGSGSMELLQHVQSRGLTVRLGDLAFALSPQLPIYTHSKEKLAYFIKSPGLENSFVRITLPTGAAISGTALEAKRDKFETALVEAGLLKAGIEAVGEDIVMGLREDAASLVSAINSNVKGSAKEHPGSTYPMTLPPGTHGVGAQIGAGSATVAGYAASAAAAFSNAAVGLGRSIVNVINEATKPPPEGIAKLKSDLAEAGYEIEDEDRQGKGRSPNAGNEESETVLGGPKARNDV